MNVKKVLKIVVFICFIAWNGMLFSQEALTKEEVTDGFSFVSSAIGNDKRWKIDGDRARFRTDGFIEIDGVRAEVFGKNEEKYYILTDRARINRNFTKIISDERITIIRGEAQITGDGLLWDADKKIAIIKKNVKVVILRKEGKRFVK